MKSEHMRKSNQLSKFEDRSESFKKIHSASKGVFVKNLNKSVLTNLQKCILSPILEGTKPSVKPEEIEITFGDL